MRRLSRTGLLVLAAFTIPLVVELRTLLGLIGIELSPAGAVAAGGVVILALVLWATVPSEPPDGSGPNGSGS